MELTDNKQSNSYGNITIVLNKQHYYPGESISGKILLRLFQDFPFSDMTLQVLGMEKLIDLKARNKDTSTIKKELYNSVNRVTPSYSQDQNVLKAGKHIFPFRLELHYNTPGTCRVSDGKIKGKIQHKVICKIISSINPSQSIIWKESINVREHITVQPQQQFSAEIYKTVYSCFECINQRECRIKCSFDRQFYSSGEYGALSILVHNESSLDIASFSVTLWNVYSKKTQIKEEQKHPNAEFDEKNQLILFKQAIREMIYEGVKAKTKETQLDNNFQFVNYNSQQPLPPTVKGVFTSNYYYVEVRAHFEGCSTQPLVLQIPISLVLSTKQPTRSLLDIQQQIMTKSRQKDQEREIIVQEFNEMTHYQIVHNEIEIYPQQTALDGIQSRIGSNQVNQYQQKSQYGGDFGGQVNYTNYGNQTNNFGNKNQGLQQNYGNYDNTGYQGNYGRNSVQDVNNSYQRLLDTPQSQKYVVPEKDNDSRLRYTQYQQSYNINIPSSQIQPRSSVTVKQQDQYQYPNQTPVQSGYQQQTLGLYQSQLEYEKRSTPKFS